MHQQKNLILAANTRVTLRCLDEWKKSDDGDDEEEEDEDVLGPLTV